MPIRSLCLLAALTSLFAAVAHGQAVPEPKFNSPYSRFGVGDLTPFAYSTQLAMGGVGLGYSDPHIATPTNPAALGALRFTSFQVGVGLTQQVLSDDALETESILGNLQYLTIAFPFQNSLNEVLDGKETRLRNAMLLSLAPYSAVGYNVEVASETAGLGGVRNSFRGSGGYYRLQWGNGFEWDEDLRFGLNLSYVFGRTNTQQITLADEVDGASRVTDTDALRARGVEAQLGAQYRLVLSRTETRVQRSLTFGATGTLGGTLNGEANRTITRLNFAGRVDTVFTTEDSPLDQSVNLPNQVGFGVYYRDLGKFGAGLDVTRVGWGGFENNQRPGERLEGSTRVAAGVEWVPDGQAFGQYLRLIRYRAGAYLNQDPRPGVNPETGVTFGLGLPIIRPREEVSYVNLSLNAGRFGTDGDVSQRYLRLVVGFTLTDNTWFYKRRFN